MVKGCRRCARPSTVLIARARDVDGTLVEQETYLCTQCRMKAVEENTAARARSTGHDPTP